MQMITDSLEEEYLELAKEIDTNSPYKRKESQKRKWMSVLEMGNLLGLKKTERYWLVHKGFFETKTVLGKMWISIDSFEKWYANQVKYQKITGEEPGKELKAWTYSPQEIAELLGLTDGVVYDLLKKEKIEVIKVDYWKRIPKEAFYKWYKNQTRYRIQEDRERDASIEAATISMPEMARLLGVKRGTVYTILASPKYKDLFETVTIAEQKRITKESFQKFLDAQDRYQLDPRNDYKEVAMEENAALATFRRKKLYRTGVRKGNGNERFLTREEAAILAKVSKTTLIRWAENGYFTEVRIGELIRINREEFEQWLEKRKEMEEI